jgi:hypothetical protein
MALKILAGNVLDAEAGALILTLDGSAKGMEGNICRQFSRKWPQVWEEIEAEIRYPIPLGNVFDYEPIGKCPFRVILLASTLHHKQVMCEAAKKSIVKSALMEAIRLAAHCGAKTVVTGLMKGGWRMSEETAFIVMADGYESTTVQYTVDLDIHVPEAGQFERLRLMAHSLGWK